MMMLVRVMPDNPVYTPGQANEMLPWLTKLLGRLLELTNSLRVVQSNVESLTQHARGNGHRDLSGDLSAANEEAERLARRTRDLLDEITGRGIQVRDVATGLVDFPGLRDGAPVWLCWKVGEPSVAHWHPYDQGYSSRKPL